MPVDMVLILVGGDTLGREPDSKDPTLAATTRASQSAAACSKTIPWPVTVTGARAHGNRAAHPTSSGVHAITL
jgi:hypothetical protein